MIVLWSGSALAWDSVGSTWPRMPVHWAVTEAPVVDDPTHDAIRAAFQTWDDVDCADVSFVEDEPTSARFGQTDGQNVVTLVTQGWPGEPALVSQPNLVQDGAEMVEADLALNLEDHLWVLDGADGRTLLDLQGGLTHEIGHLLGLWHSTVADASLNPALAGHPEARDLADDDIEGICALYPAGGSAGGGHLGDACTETPDCASDLQCVADAGEQYCAPACGAGDTCPDGYTCLDGTGGGICAKATGCGCAAVGGASPWPSIGLLLVVLRRRRPRG